MDGRGEEQLREMKAIHTCLGVLVAVARGSFKGGGHALRGELSVPCATQRRPVSQSVSHCYPRVMACLEENRGL